MKPAHEMSQNERREHLELCLSNARYLAQAHRQMSDSKPSPAKEEHATISADWHKEAERLDAICKRL